MSAKALTPSLKFKVSNIHLKNNIDETVIQ